MKTGFVFFVLAILVCAVLPAVLAKNDENQGNGQNQREGNDEKGKGWLKNVFDNISENSTGREIATAIKEATTARFLEFQQQRLNRSIDFCDENATNATLCQQRLEKRINQTEKLADKKAEILQKIIHNRLMLKDALDKLKENPALKKYKEAGSKARKLGAGIIGSMEKLFKKASQNHEEGVKSMQEAKKNFDKAKKDSNTTEMKLATIDYLKNATDVIQQQLDKLKAKVESSEDLTDNESAIIVARIDEWIGETQQLENKLGNLTANSTKDEINAARQEVIDLWKEVRPLILRDTEALIHAKLGGLLVQSKQLEVKLSKVLEKMTEQGKNTTKVEMYVDRFHQQITAAEEYYYAARDKLVEASVAAGESQNGLIEQVHTLVTKSKEELKAARETLRSLTAELRQQNMTSALETEPGDNAEDSVDNEILAEG